MPRSRRRWLAGLACLVVVPVAAAAPAPAASPPYVTRTSVVAAAATFAESRGYRIGVAVLDRTTGQTFTAGDARSWFQSESVVKVFIATRVLLQGRMHGHVATLAHRMIVVSDDNAASALYGGVGGDGLITWVKKQYHQSNLGLPPRYPGWWGDTRISALGLVQLYAKLAKDQRVGPWLLRTMHQAQRHGSDGYNQFFGIPAATRGAAIKQGWGCDRGGGCHQADRNSTGFVNGDRYAVALLVRGPRSSYGPKIDAVITGAARALLPGGAFPLAAPVVSTVSIRSGSSLGGQLITVHGSRFAKVRSVRFGATSAPVVHVLSATTLRVKVPAHKVGTVPVRVVTDSGASPTVARAQYTFVAPPSIAALSSAVGSTSGGKAITITGHGFTGVTRVAFGTASATKVSVHSSTALSATVPPHARGLVAVRVIGRYGSSSGGPTFRYVAAPVLSSLSSDKGDVAGGGTVTLIGVDFVGVQQVTFGDQPATKMTVLSPTQVQVVVPPHPAGVVDVRVVTDYGTSPVTSADQYTYQASPPVP